MEFLFPHPAHPALRGTTFSYYSRRKWVSKICAPVTNPYSDGYTNGGFDTLEPTSTAKNILSVGAVNDAVSGGARSLAAAGMLVFSGWGPTDDGHIKPDVVGNGVPWVTWTPDLGTARVYHVEGRTNLTEGAWGPTNASSRFFHVNVWMP